MNIIYFLQGAHGSGKTRLVHDQHLEDQTVSIDDLMRMVNPHRAFYDAPKQTVSYGQDITGETMRAALDMAANIIDRRMRSGDTIIVDYTSTRRKKLTPMLRLADHYNYRVAFVDVQANQSLQDVFTANQRREGSFWSDEEIKKSWDDAAKFQISKDEEQISISEFLSRRTIAETDVSDYSSVRVIGDIQGCYQTFLKSSCADIRDDEFTVFCGDLFDRGPEEDAGPMFDWLVKHIDDPNRVFIRGNHDTYIKYYAMGDFEPTRSTRATISEIIRDAKSVSGSEKKLRRLSRMIDRKMVDCFAFNFHGRHAFCSHGGVHPDMLPYHDRDGIRSYDIGFSSGYDYWYGTGSAPMISDYGIDIDDIVNRTDSDIIQFHGHRNERRHDPHDYDGVFNLETRVDKGGVLSIARLDGRGITIEQYA
jgi:predicted kinase